MLLADLVTQVQRRFGDGIGSVITQADVFAWVNEGTIEIGKQTKISFLETPITVTSYLSSGISVPDGLTVEYVKYNDIFLDIKDYRLFDNILTATGRPQWYYQQGFSSNNYTLKLYPNPDSTMGSDVIKVGQQSISAPVANIGDAIPVPPSYHPDLMNFCLMRAHERNKDWQGMDKALQMFNLGLAQRVTQGEVVEDSNPVIMDMWETYGPVGFY